MYLFRYSTRIVLLVVRNCNIYPVICLVSQVEKKMPLHTKYQRDARDHWIKIVRSRYHCIQNGIGDAIAVFKVNKTKWSDRFPYNHVQSVGMFSSICFENRRGRWKVLIQNQVYMMSSRLFVLLPGSSGTRLKDTFEFTRCAISPNYDVASEGQKVVDICIELLHSAIVESWKHINNFEVLASTSSREGTETMVLNDSNDQRTSNDASQEIDGSIKPGHDDIKT